MTTLELLIQAAMAAADGARAEEGDWACCEHCAWQGTEACDHCEEGDQFEPIEWEDEEEGVATA